MADRVGGVFDRKEEMMERLQQGPGKEAQETTMPSGEGPLPSRWTLQGIRATFSWLRDYTLSGVWRVLDRYGLTLRSGRVQRFSPDPEYATKLAYLLDCLRTAATYPGEVVLLFMDETGFYRWPRPAKDWSGGPPDPVPAAPCADNNRQWRIIGVLNALTGQIDYIDNYRTGRRQVIELYNLIDTTYFTARHIYVVQDNWPVHHHDEVMAAIVTLDRIEPVWLPTYAPWLNPIEKLWRWLKEAVLKMHRLAADWSALLSRVRAFLDQFDHGSQALLRYVGLLGDGKLAQALNVT
jgi:hypothetical protein